MGGKAFTHLKPPLWTPRLSPTLYHSLRTKYLALLSTFYNQVATPLEAPEKPSYGDIDILVASPLSANPPTPLGTALAARTSLTHPSSPIASYALPHPLLAHAYVQLDIHVCSAATFAFEVFRQSHGDLWSILGSSMRMVGLTATNSGLHLRIPEIDAFDRKQSLLHLTSDPDAVLDFLGLDRCSRWRVFNSVDEMFLYAASAPFFRREAYVRERMRAKDRKRVAQRELYRRFVEEWVPRMTGGGEETVEAEGWKREGVLGRALDVFGKRGEYEKRLGEWRAERRELGVKRHRNEARRANAVAEVEYADAWIRQLRREKS
ncbi:hypothetical protein LPUS_12488 [Lasallia pustulata]|uniref:Uncharacterized protein n=1 Tax=Lasallia pustulata TaxID=136370 RepID=A0A1W5DE31_9LECA|nr:hypothetical protein LPUS_12488 [Lasallia pustulata]